MRTLVVIAALFFLASCGMTGRSPAAVGQAKLSGTWQCVSAAVDGTDVPVEKVRQLRLTLTETVYRTQLGPQVIFDSTYALDPTEVPKQINITGTEAEMKGRDAQGIYVVEDDRLILCYTMPDGARPDSFDSVPGSGAYLMVWKRLDE